ncbi:N-lysine methyltransferase setd6-like [Dysidea avara]|uniref:N-lysine methyltransferase setd6-like n=1 Tax=Dysidea avara TaxID=196820 RepID=UPI003330535E
MDSQRKRKWRWKSCARPKKLQRLSVRKEDASLYKFVLWCKAVGIRINDKVTLTRHGSCANIGMIARRPITEGTWLAKIPRTAVLCCSNSKLSRTLQYDSDLCPQLPELTSWLPLILSLLYEQDKQDSYWRPYLDIVPNKESLSPPLLWTPEERTGLLAGTSVAEQVQGDYDHMMQEYTSHALPFMTKHNNLYSPHQQGMEQYSKMVGLVMSYSFSDPEEDDPLKQTMMVPVIDLLNHHSNHHAELTFHEKYLLLTAIRDIKKGEEVMNTYGPLCNAGLVRMYGFAESDNPNDKAYIPVSLVKELSVEEAVQSDPTMLTKRWKSIINKYEIVEDDEFMEVSLDDTESLLLLIKMLHAPIGQVKSLLKYQSMDISDLSSHESSFAIKLICKCLELLPLAVSCKGCSQTRQQVSDILRSGQRTCLLSIKQQLESETKRTTSL